MVLRKGAAARADRRLAHLASCAGRPRPRLEENHSVGACGDRMILRKDAGAGRAEAASLPPRRNLSAAPGAGEEGPGSERYGECADLHGASGDAQGELCSPPLHSRRGKSTDEAEKGRTQARSMWSERRYRATRRAVFSPYAGQPPRCSLRGFPLQTGRVRGDQAARRAVFSHMRDSRRADLPRRGLPSGGRLIQRAQAASDTEEAAAEAIPFAPATAADDVERAEISPDD